MNQPTAPQLLAALSAERAALLDFLSLLQREQGMLVENLTEQLFELSEKKSAAALNLNQLAEKRRTLMQQIIPQADAASIQAWLKTHSPQGMSTWRETLSLARRAKQLNQTNGELINMKMRRNQQILSVLSNAVDKANLYGPDGQTSFSPGSGRSLGSG